jgi:hypothetical protein
LNNYLPDLCLLSSKVSGVSQQGLVNVYYIMSTVSKQVLERDIAGDLA